jgi:hypothetical protein
MLSFPGHAEHADACLAPSVHPVHVHSRVHPANLSLVAGGGEGPTACRVCLPTGGYMAWTQCPHLLPCISGACLATASPVACCARSAAACCCPGTGSAEGHGWAVHRKHIGWSMEGAAAASLRGWSRRVYHGARTTTKQTVCALCAVCCVLCAVCCVLCAVCCVLCAVCCVYHGARAAAKQTVCALFSVLCAVCCVLCAVSCVLCAVCCVLCAVCCVLCAVCCVLCAVCCVLCTVCCILSRVLYCLC